MAMDVNEVPQHFIEHGCPHGTDLMELVYLIGTLVDEKVRIHISRGRVSSNTLAI